MKLVFGWIIKNLWNLFGVIGVVGMFYFSLLHVPDYVKEITTGKVNIIHESLMDDIQEILFYEKELSIEGISSFIKGKELKRGVLYPYTTDELLVQVQERFMSNKFIPLEKREALLNKIQEIRSTYSPPKTPIDKPYDWSNFISWLFSGLGVLIASLGATSIVKKLRTDKETEVDIISGDIATRNYHGSRVAAAFEYEKMVGEALTELNVMKPLEKTGRDIGYDFEASDGNNDYIVEVKMYRKMLGLSTARDFMYKVNQSGKGGVLVALSGATQRTKELINEHNEISENQKVHLIIGTSKSAVKKQLSKLFHTNASNK